MTSQRSMISTGDTKLKTHSPEVSFLGDPLTFAWLINNKIQIHVTAFGYNNQNTLVFWHSPTFCEIFRPIFE